MMLSGKKKKKKGIICVMYAATELMEVMNDESRSQVLD